MKLRQDMTSATTRSRLPLAGTVALVTAALVLGLASSASAAFKPLFAVKSDTSAVTLEDRKSVV